MLLFRRSAFGYLLSSVVLVIGFTMGAALLAMSVGQILAGVQVDPVALVIFTALAATDMVLSVLLFRSITDIVVQPVSMQNRPRAEATRAPGEYLASPHKS